MDKSQAQLETLQEIRALMERSSRFISLTGLSGVIAGISALCGIMAIYLYFDLSIDSRAFYQLATTSGGSANMDFYAFVITDLTVVLVVSIFAALILTIRKARKNQQPIWDATARRLMTNMLIPLITGGIFCLALAFHGHIAMIAPATMIFYGLALIHASKYTLNDIRYLGIAEIGIGLVASFFPAFGLLFWALGFGILHIIYGVTMYIKYER